MHENNTAKYQYNGICLCVLKTSHWKKLCPYIDAVKKMSIYRWRFFIRISKNRDFSSTTSQMVEVEYIFSEDR